MEIQIGEALFLGGDSVYKLSAPISGLRSPEIRTFDGTHFVRDGGFVSGHFYGYRTITINGFYIGKDCEDASNLRRVLFGYLRIRYVLPIIITMQDGKRYYTEGYVADVKSNIENLVAGEFQITLSCPDPAIYELDGRAIVWNEVALDDGITNRNLFNKSASPNNANGTTIQELDTGVRAIAPSATTSTGHKWSVFIIGEAEDFAGKTVTVSYEATPSAETRPGVNIGLTNDLTASSRTSKASSTVSGKNSISWKVQTQANYPYLVVWFYSSDGTPNNAGDYVDYTNVMLSVSETPQDYIPYGDPISTTVTNEGGMDAKPVITVLGAVNEIEIENKTTGKTMQVEIETGESDGVVIDMEHRAITLNGETVSEYRTPQSSWWVLEPGENEIVTSIDTLTDSQSTTVLKYKKGFIGI